MEDLHIIKNSDDLHRLVLLLFVVYKSTEIGNQFPPSAAQVVVSKRMFSSPQITSRKNVVISRETRKWTSQSARTPRDIHVVWNSIICSTNRSHDHPSVGQKFKKADTKTSPIRSIVKLNMYFHEFTKVLMEKMTTHSGKHQLLPSFWRASYFLRNKFLLLTTTDMMLFLMEGVSKA
uniref:Ovule protein n=1 Tax=Heterorhabditis bacteriophora TaxID=37862 RepID=A0A1I7X6B0_HETBA